MCYIYNNNIYKKPNLHIYIYIFCRHGSSQPDRKKTGKKWGSSIFRHVDSCIIIGCKPIYIPLFILLFLSAFLLFPFLSYPSFPLRALSLSLSLSLSSPVAPLYRLLCPFTSHNSTNPRSLYGLYGSSSSLSFLEDSILGFASGGNRR